MLGPLAKRLLLARKDLDWNQLQLADRSGISRQYISDLERGRIVNPTIDVIAALAGALDIPPAHLAGWIDNPSGESIAEGHIAYTVDPRIQELIDLYDDLDPANQAIALEIIRTIRRSQHVITVGGS